eukprot:CAMPEP_0115237150 /NCGR_PEP_ID=MMETSP0270-20121206/36214_1 /TAXON_ID=71861 /ORGANISM="Scrippsiella trochoidea, Strain CCMP3099" /LENGTH=34 /DNA_ID= /DNA_START= /DNA_END= /DNA_ORIENTATION=
MHVMQTTNLSDDQAAHAIDIAQRHICNGCCPKKV